MDTETFKFLVQGGSFAILAFLTLWMFVRQIPKMEERGAARDKLFVDSVDKSQQTFLASLDKQHQEHREEQKNIADRQDANVARLESAIRDRMSKG